MYQLTNSPTIIRLADHACIPPDSGNTDYAAFLEWVEAGNTPEPAPEPAALAELMPAEKLARSGLTVDELKELLGID
jgi:hypothetical protein